MATKDIPSGSAFVSGDTAPTVREKLNANLAWAEEQAQGVEDRLEGAIGVLVGTGVVTGLAVAPGNGLSVDVGAGVAVLGFAVARSAAQTGIAVAASATNHVFLRQDGGFETNTSGAPPTGMASLLLATALVGESAVISVDNDPAGKPKLSLLPGLGVGEGIATALIAEGLVGFDAATGHQHDGVDSRPLVGTPANTFSLGDGEAGDKTLEAATGGTNPPALRYDDAFGEWRFSNDGTTWKSMAPPEASVEARGLVELASTAEVSAGSDSERAVTPAGLAGSSFGQEGLRFVVCGASTDAAVGDGLEGAAIGAELDGFRVVGVVAAVHTAGATGPTEVQIRRRRAGVDADVLSVKCRIESGEHRSTDAATQPVVDTDYDDLASGDLVYVDVDAVSATAPKGLSVVVRAAKN